MDDQKCEYTIRRGPIAREGGFTSTNDLCGAPATVESGQTLCRNHRLRLDQAAFGPVAEDNEVLRRTCHAAPETMMLGRYYPGETLSTAPEWRAARVEITAFPLSEDSHIPIAWPWAYEQFPGIDGPCIVARWRLRYPGKPGILNVTWDARRRPDERFRRSVTAHGVGVLPEDIAGLWRLWTTESEGATRTEATIRAVHRVGSPGHFSGPDDPRVIPLLRNAAHEAVKDGERVTFASLGRRGFGDWRTAQKYVAAYDLDAIYREAARCTSGVNTCRFHVRHAADYLKNRG